MNGSQLAATNDRVSTAEGKIAQNMTAIGGLDTRVGTAESNIAQDTADVANNTSAIGGLDTRVGATEDSIAKHTSDIASNASTISNIDSRVSSVEGSVTNLTQQLSSSAVGLVKQDTGTQAITVASETGGKSVDITGTEGARTLSGVKEGPLFRCARATLSVAEVVAKMARRRNQNRGFTITICPLTSSVR
ncbi:hypothetical protein F6X37_35850, partial [Paraburkholderia sp. 31.1]|nr:hypothetical protein [Paraburkholderia sp. 31.1]